eukprot:860951_1
MSTTVTNPNHCARPNFNLNNFNLTTLKKKISTMNGFTSKLVVHAIYIFFVTQIRSQYTQIWYDSMISKGRWTSSDDSLVTFNYQSAGCITGNCLKTDGQYGVNAYVYTYTGVAAFSSLQLQFDVSTDGLELTKTCTVYYAYNSESNK